MRLFGSDSALDGVKTELAELKVQVSALRREKEALKKVDTLESERNALKSEIVDLKIDKARIVEDQQKREREIEHKVGLQKKRQEQELELGLKGARLEVRQANLESEKSAFANQMKFQQTRFESEVGYLKDILGEILDRLPTVTVDAVRSKK